MNLPNETILQIIKDARLAPSVHNTQPWRVKAETNAIIVRIDTAHKLADGDPTGRQTIISLGIFTEAIIIAAKARGLGLTKLNFTGSSVTINLEKSSRGSNNDISLLRGRSSDRSIYMPVSIPNTLVAGLKNATNQFYGIGIHVLKERKTTALVAHLTAKGIGLALSNPSFRSELSTYLVEPWSKKHRGIAVKSLYIPLWLAVLQPILVKRGWAVRQEVELEHKRWLSASAIIVITGQGDLSKYWFDAGRVYLQTSLIVEAHGLSQATSAAIVEASDYHVDLENHLGINDRILAIIRIGQGKKTRSYSPRLSAEELLTSN